MAYDKKAAEKFLRHSRRAWLHSLKDRPCMDCGGSFPPQCMDFDHRPNEAKSFTIGMKLTVSKARLLEEVAKCDIVCANCHRLRTWERRDHLRKNVSYEPKYAHKTTSEWEQIASDYLSGMSLKACAEKYKSSSTGIYKGLKRLGVTLRHVGAPKKGISS